MDVALLAARVALAGVFLVAGAAKLADLPGARAAAFGLRIPRWLAGVGAPALAGFETVIGLALLTARSAPYAAVAAAVTIAGLTALAGSAIARGLRPECHCFGRLGSGRIGRGTLLRNVVILAVAAFAAVGEREHPGAAQVAGLGRLPMTAAAVATALLVAGGTAGLTRSNASSRTQGRAAIAPPGREPSDQAGRGVGSPAPDFLLDDVAGGSLSLQSVLSPGEQALLTFVDMRCGECLKLMRSLAAWQRKYVPSLTIAVVAAGERNVTAAKAAQHGLDGVGHDPERAVFAAYGVVRTPAAVLLAPDGTVASPVTPGAAGITSLVAGLPARVFAAGAGPATRMRRGEAARPMAAIQRPVPPAEQVVLRSVDGRVLGLRELLGSSRLMVFIRPECIFSRRLLPELQELHAQRHADGPELVIICHGDPEQLGLGQLRLPIYLDISGAAGPALGVRATPAAVLARPGLPASPAVSGAPQILAMMRGETPASRDCGCLSH